MRFDLVGRDPAVLLEQLAHLGGDLGRAEAVPRHVLVEGGTRRGPLIGAPRLGAVGGRLGVGHGGGWECETRRGEKEEGFMDSVEEEPQCARRVIL